MRENYPLDITGNQGRLSSSRDLQSEIKMLIRKGQFNVMMVNSVVIDNHI